MKTNIILTVLLLLTITLQAQIGTTYSFDLSKAEDLKQIRIVSSENFDVVYAHIDDLVFRESPFIAVSVRLEGQRLDDDLTLQIHAKDDNKTTVSYQTLHHFHESEEDPSRIFVSELAFLDKTTSHIQVVCKLEKPALAKLNTLHIRVFNPCNIPPVTTEPQSILGACDAPPSVSRSVWGANWGLTNNVQYKSTPSYSTVTHLIVHHSAGPNTSTNWAATVASIFDYHVNSNGWSDVGYNYLIAPDGTLFYGRGGGNNVVGAHYCAKNNNTMGVCMMGTYTTVAPTDTAWRTLEKIFAWKAYESNINPTASAPLSNLGSIPVINGHRSGCETECPGDSNFNRLPALRLRLGAMVAACRAVSTQDITSNLSAVILSPNPVVNGTITLKAELVQSEPLNIKAFDALGRQVFEKTLTDKSLLINENLDISHLAQGAYIFKVMAGQSAVSQKVVIE